MVTPSPSAASVLLNRSIFSVIQVHQYGIYEDMRPRFHEVQTMVKFERRQGSDNPGLYTLPRSFRPLAQATRDPDTQQIQLHTYDLCLHEGHRDPRLPLHLAIFEGNLALVKRLLVCRPDLGSMDALFCAVKHQHEALVDYLVHALDEIPTLRRPPTDDAKRISFRNYHLVDVAAARGSLPILKLLHVNGVGDATTAALAAAAGAGRLDMVQFLHAERAEGGSSDAMNNAAMNGHLAVVQFLHAHGFRCTRNALDLASSNGHLEVVQFLHTHRTEGCTRDALNAAARGGHLAVVRFLHANRTEGCTTAAMDGAAAKGHLDMVQFLHEHRTEGCTQRAMDDAAFWGHASIVEFLSTHRTEGGSLDPWSRCVIQGNLDILKALYRIHGTFGRVDYRVLVEKLELIEFLHGIGQPMDNLQPATKAVAALLHAHGVPVSDEDVSRAATEGRFDVVKFYHEHGAPFTGHVMDAAASSGHLDIVEFLHSNRTEGCTTAAMDEAVHVQPPSKALEIVQFLHAHRTEGCTTQALDGAAGNGHLDLVRFLSENRPEGCTTQAMDDAAAKGFLEIVQYLNEHRTEGCTTEAMDTAAANGYLPIVEYLFDHRSEGCTTQALKDAVRLGTANVVQFLVSHGDKGVNAATTKASIAKLLPTVQGKANFDNSWETIANALGRRLEALD
ncbi:Aste57867_10328 [Aphanomyces stellatus]|uniref:Aste57867_10328 protein n=1 Tax=Aphanomyces stellatus TaxID=120398 RepID=A0A485KQL6_9STRA|nr:hypothetical protein As57867_010288 [Aphanomyces stellatus]VFT87202.1 Aste57867_10328 [Aphanomyces stellatus]